MQLMTMQEQQQFVQQLSQTRPHVLPVTAVLLNEMLCKHEDDNGHSTDGQKHGWCNIVCENLSEECCLCVTREQDYWAKAALQSKPDEPDHEAHYESRAHYEHTCSCPRS